MDNVRRISSSAPADELQQLRREVDGLRYLIYKTMERISLILEERNDSRP